MDLEELRDLLTQMSVDISDGRDAKLLLTLWADALEVINEQIKTDCIFYSGPFTEKWMLEKIGIQDIDVEPGEVYIVSFASDGPSLFNVTGATTKAFHFNGSKDTWAKVMINCLRLPGVEVTSLYDDVTPLEAKIKTIAERAKKINQSTFKTTNLIKVI